MITWMERYRELVAALVRHSNTIAGINSKKQPFCEGIALKNHEIQVLEYLIDNEDKHASMMEIVHALSIPQSSFSKITSVLENAGLIEKFHTGDNRKNIVIRPTRKGKDAYAAYTAGKNETGFGEFFGMLRSLDDESLKTVTSAINLLTDRISEAEGREK